MIISIIGAGLNVGDIQYCELGKHYWHFVGNTQFIRKFYIAERRIKTPSLEEQINSIPTEECPDAQHHSVEREGTLIINH